jgi:hypothetical protein
MNRLTAIVLTCVLCACGAPELAEFSFEVEEAQATSARTEPLTTQDGLSSTVGTTLIDGQQLPHVAVGSAGEEGSLIRNIQFDFFGPVTAGSVFTVIPSEEKVRAGAARVHYSEFTVEQQGGDWQGAGGSILVTRVREHGFDFTFRVQLAPVHPAARGTFVAVGTATIRSLSGFNGKAP